jgi:RNA polymerase sigma-70 factor (ECF subfamily)
MASRQAGFERVALPHLDTVYRMARRLTGSDTEADDLVQETFLRAYRGFETFQLRQYGAKPWLLKILHNVFYTRVGREARQPGTADQIDFDEVAENQRAGGIEIDITDLNWDAFDQELKGAINTLSPEHREVLLLWALEGFSYKEIAEVCGCAIGTVMSRLYRARQQVSEKLAGYAKDRGLGQDQASS